MSKLQGQVVRLNRTTAVSSESRQVMWWPDEGDNLALPPSLQPRPRPTLRDSDFLHPARWEARLGARVIDMLVLAPVVGVVMFVGLSFAISVDPVWGMSPDSASYLMFIIGLVLLPFAYETVAVSLWGRTVGKRIRGLKVVRPGHCNSLLWPVRVIIRTVAGLLLTLTLITLNVWTDQYAYFGVMGALAAASVLNFAWPLWDKPWRRCLHDVIAGTVVINDESALPGHSR